MEAFGAAATSSKPFASARAPCSRGARTPTVCPPPANRGSRARSRFCEPTWSGPSSFSAVHPSVVSTDRLWRCLRRHERVAPRLALQHRLPSLATHPDLELAHRLFLVHAHHLCLRGDRIPDVHGCGELPVLAQEYGAGPGEVHRHQGVQQAGGETALHKSEERRVGKECRSRWSRYQ